MKLSQKEKVHVMLKGAGPRGVHSFEFYEAGFPRAAERIRELKAEGIGISNGGGKREKFNGEAEGVRYTLTVGVGASKPSEGLHSAPGGHGPLAETASADSSGQLFEVEKPKSRPNYMDVWDDGKAA